MMDENLQLPCEKCGKLIDYDGVSAAGANTVCEHCGSKKPHTLRGNPLLPFLFFFIGALAFALINPIGLSEDAMFLGCFGVFCLLLWSKVFLPYHIAKLKRQVPGVKAMGCFSFLILGFAGISLFFCAAEINIHGLQATTTYHRVGGHKVEDGFDSVPKSESNGKASVIWFSNESGIRIRLHRFDNEGTIKSDRDLVPRQGIVRDTFEGETWVVTDLDDTPLYYYIAGSKASAAIVPP
tara:strand:- start:240 stop:953 length:714 start_codon:yes stop_codon:yes gene_type:complete